MNRTPAWRLVSVNTGVRDGRAFTTVDSVYVGRFNVRLLRRVAIQTPFSRYGEIRIQQRFSGDSVLGRMNAEGAAASLAGRPIARRLAPSAIPYAADAFAPVLFGAVDLHAGWRGALSLVGWAVVDGDVQIPALLRVDGEEVLSVPAGKFECWRLAVQYAGRTRQYWVRKSDGVAVKSLQTSPGDGVREVILTRVTE